MHCMVAAGFSAFCRIRRSLACPSRPSSFPRSCPHHQRMPVQRSGPRIRSDVRDDKSHEDGTAIKRFLVEKLAASILEFADRRLTQGTVFTVGEIEAPLVRLRVVESQVQTFEMTDRAIDTSSTKVGSAIPHLADDGSPVILDPGGGSSYGMLEARDVSFPGTPDFEVEIVLAVSSLQSLRSSLRRACIVLCGRRTREKN